VTVAPVSPWLDLRVVATRGATGPATARNTGWREAVTPWVVFLDDDVVVHASWVRDLLHDLAAADRPPSATGGIPRVGGVQGRISVPLPAHRRPTDRERIVAGLERAPWVTADMAVRREALAAVGGFDERFPRAYREDSDLGIRVRSAGWAMVVGSRRVDHPVAAAPWSASLHAQRGNADDARMRHAHGRRWRELAGAPPSWLGRHVLTTAAGVAAVATALRAPRVSLAAAAVWLASTADFAWRRVRPGPRTSREVLTMIVTSVLIPPAAVRWRVQGHLGELGRRRPARRSGPTVG
jgi:GT2 family glycosyltransferase